MGRRDYNWQHEPCLYGWKDEAAHLWATDRKQTTILNFDRPSRSSEHPTTTTVELFGYQMLNNREDVDPVLDSFLGSGTTIIACEKHGCSARAMELDPIYADVAINCWQDYTDQDIIHQASTKSFNKLKNVVKTETCA